MSLTRIPSNEGSPRGISVTTLLGICIVLLLLLAGGFGALWYFSFSDNAKLKSRIREQEALADKIKGDQKKGANDEVLALARSSQAEALVTVRQATNAVGELRQAILTTQDHLAALRTNSAGREIALYPDLVAQARRVYESDATELPTDVAVVERFESLRRMEQQLVEASGSAYNPDGAFKSSIASASAWARSNLEKVRTVESALSSLERESRIKVFTGTKPAEPISLAAAIQRLNESEIASRQKTIIEKTSDAKDTAADLVAKAEAGRILADAKAKRDEILREAEETAAAMKREAQIRDAQGVAKDTDAGLQSKKILDAATRQKLLTKAADSQIQLKLASLTTPGYYQDRRNEVEKVPVSLTVLQSAGALNPDEKGMNTLARIVSSREDKVRPRLKFAPNYQWKRFPEQIEQIKELQALLIELAPVLVEKGMLAP